jgi:uncharacterized LabA/DUF88 family protein
MIFIDFWNFTLHMQNMEKDFRIDWPKVPEVFLEQLRLKNSFPEAKLVYAGCEVLGSCSPTETKLRHWAKTFLSGIDGVSAIFLPRQKLEKGPNCTGVAHHEIATCPVCNAPMLGYKEKGVDTTIVALMLQKAWLKIYDVAILVSSDKDFVPVVHFLKDQSVECVQAGFSGSGYELASSCWCALDIEKFCESFRRASK